MGGRKTFAGDECPWPLQLLPEFGQLSLSELRRRASDSFVADRAIAGSLGKGCSGSDPVWTDG